MNRWLYLPLAALLALGATTASAAGPAPAVTSGAVNHHLAFEDLKFLDADFVARSG